MLIYLLWRNEIGRHFKRGKALLERGGTFREGGYQLKNIREHLLAVVLKVATQYENYMITANTNSCISNILCSTNKYKTNLA